MKRYLVFVGAVLALPFYLLALLLYFLGFGTMIGLEYILNIQGGKYRNKKGKQ